MRLILALLALSSPALAFTPEFPGPATVTREATVSMDSFALPLGPWTEAEFPVQRVEGRISRIAWRIEAPRDFSTLSLLIPLRDALSDEGWEIILDCRTDDCGGYDFRYRLDLFPEPEMHVDLGDFRYLSARKGVERVGVMVSRTSELGFVQVTRATEGRIAPVRPAPPPQRPATTPTFGNGATVLEGLNFAPGSASLEGEQPALQRLADWMRANPQAQVTLVGHTDASGGLEANIAVSRQRAGAARDWLVAQGIEAARLDAQGVGYLSPRDTNETDAGRARNRRVEAVVGQ